MNVMDVPEIDCESLAKMCGVIRPHPTVRDTIETLFFYGEEQGCFGQFTIVMQVDSRE